jgi:hypothetical protein
LQFIFWTNPKRIYLVGCDCNQKGHFNDQNEKGKEIIWSEGLIEMIESYKNIKEFRNLFYPETEIISINPVGLKGMFNDAYM